jgi:hypothetical protein
MGVVLILMTICGLVLAAILLVFAYATGKNWLRTFVLGGVVTWMTGYIILLFIGSFFSVERNLAFNEAKEYCGFYLDCHMHTAVTDVRRAKTLGDLTANGEFYIVNVKVFSNARAATLGLLTVDAHVVDAGGHAYTRDMKAEAQLPPQPEFEKRISPAESFEKEIVFDLPADAKNPRLDMREGYGIDHAIEAVLIGDEDSIMHKRNYFRLQEQNDTASVK